MRRARSPWTAILLILLVVQNAWLFYPRLRGALLGAEVSAAARGRELAHELGCFACHGPAGRGGVPNPGSQEDMVPSFHQGTPMMYVASEDEIREYILDGAPASKRARASYREQMQAQALQMPAYRGWITEPQLEDLVAYVRAVSDLLFPDSQMVDKGARIAAENACLDCHGEMGSGGVSNPGSLKGYIPGFTGSDFYELVRDDEELIAWIRDGSIPRIREHFIGSYFFARQRLQMPAYREFLTDDEIRAVAAYVRWLAEGGWRNQPIVRGPATQPSVVARRSGGSVR